MKKERGVVVKSTLHRISLSIKVVRPHAFYLATLLSASCVVFTWFRGFILYQWDETFPFNPPATIQSYLWPWSNTISTGVPAVVSKDLPYLLVVFLFHNLFGLSLLTSEMSLYYALLSIGGVAMYFFFISQSNVLHSKEIRFGAFAASITYMFNPYWMVYVWQIFSLEAFLYAALPIMLLFFQRVFLSGAAGRNDWGGYLGLASASVLAAPAIGIPAFSIPLVVGFAGFYALWLIHPSSSKKRLGSLRSVSLASIVLLAVHLWWLIPEALLFGSQLTRAGGSLYGLPGLQDLLANSQNSDYLNVLRIVGSPPLYRTLNYPHYDFSWVYQASFLPLTLVSIGMISTALLALALKVPLLKPSALLFAGVSIIGGVPLVAGIQPPFGPAFQWVVIHVPSLATLFRDPYQKFGFWIPFGCSFLVGATFLTVMHKTSHQPDNTSAKESESPALSKKWLVAMALLLVLIGPVYAWPMFSGDVIPSQTAEVPSGRIEVPTYYFQAATWLQSQGNDFRILSLPEDQILQSSNWNHGYAGQDILRFLSGESIISTDPQIPDLGNFQHGLYSYIANGGDNLTSVLRLLDVRFVLLRMDAGFYPATTQYANLTALHLYLENQSGLRLVRQFGLLLFFETANSGAQVFVGSQIFKLSQLNRVGWDLARYAGGWQTSSANLTTGAAGLVETTESPGSYSYGYASTNRDLNFSTVNFPYVKVNFHTSSNAALLLRLRFNDGNNVWLTAFDSGNATIHGGNHYSSLTPTTLTYDLSTIPGTVNAMDLFVTNAPLPSSIGRATLFIKSLTAETYAGLRQDYVRAVAQLSENPLTYAIIGDDDSALMNPDGSSPNITYVRVNPVEYRVDVQNSRSQFVLVLCETFDGLWHLSEASGSNVDATHILVDGFANGWLVRTMGNFTLWIDYGPRGVFLLGYIGSLIAGLSLAATAVITRRRGRLKPQE